MRTFVGIDWSLAALKCLSAWKEFLQGQGVQGYWRAQSNLHVTLKFLGEVEPVQIAGIEQALQRAGQTVKPFVVSLSGLGVFPNLKEPRILWVGVQGQALLRLQAAVEQELEPLGFRREKRPFTPHVTLASGGIKGFNPSFSEGLPKFREEVMNFELIESLANREGRSYVTLSEFRVGGI